MSFNDFFAMTDFPTEAAVTVTTTFDTVKNDPRFKALLDKIERHGNFDELETDCYALADDININRYTLLMTLFVSASDIMHKRFSDAGYSDIIFWDTISDLKYKAVECKKTHGVWGNRHCEWNCDFFEVNRFKLGRLQFEKHRFPFDYVKLGNTQLSKADMCYFVHIPSCGPLLYEDILDSYRKAYDFLPLKKDGSLVLICYSWLLFPDYRGPIFKEGSNIYKFASDYKSMEVRYMCSFRDAWRVFGKELNSETFDSLPEETSLQKNFKKRFLNGEEFGMGYGVLLFDGKSIISR